MLAPFGNCCVYPDNLDSSLGAISLFHAEVFSKSKAMLSYSCFVMGTVGDRDSTGFGRTDGSTSFGTDGTECAESCKPAPVKTRWA